MNYCHYCGAQVKDGQKFCTHCGANLLENPEEKPTDPVSKTSPEVDKIIDELIKENEQKHSANQNVEKSNNNKANIVVKQDYEVAEINEKPKKAKTLKPENKNSNGSRIVGNVFWLILGGLLWGVSLFIGAIGCFISILGIPAGFQYMKMSKFVFSPFGKEVYIVQKGFWRTLANVIWCISLGLASCIAFGLFGILLCVTIIGIPFAKQYFKLAKFVLWPYGRDFRIADKQ